MSEPLVAKAIDALRREDFAGARAIIVDYERENPLALQHYQIRGLAELALKDWRAAQNTFSAATLCYPDNAILFFNLGMAQENLGDLKNAAMNYERSLQLNPDQAEACGNLSNLYCRMVRFADAEKMAREALRLGAPRAQALNSLGLALDRQNRPVEARAVFEEALQFEPNNILVLSNLANVAADRFDFEEALKFFAKARAKSDAPFLRHQEGMARLLSGDYKNGWPLYEARLEMHGGLRVRPPCPRYSGEALNGKTLMLVAEQGFGDVIQFCRYGSLLEKRGAKLVWAVPENLRLLLAGSVPGQVIGEIEMLPEADFYLPILSLNLTLGLFDPKLAPVPPYLKAPEQAPQLPSNNSKQRIGLVWAGSGSHERDHERSIAPECFAGLLEKIPAQFYAPFIGAGVEKADGLPITRLDHLIGDFADTAALLKQLNCLITVDTAAAHLAGALGVKTYLLLPHCPDWRWGTKGETTPWYGNHTLLRQQRPVDWEAPLARLAELLTKYA